MSDPLKRTPIRIEIEYADGYLERAVGDAAAAIVKHYHDLEVLDYVHGGRYTGRTMRPVDRSDDDLRSIALSVQLAKDAEWFRSQAEICRDYGWDAMAAEFDRHGNEADAVLAKATEGERDES